MHNIFIDKIYPVKGNNIYFLDTAENKKFWKKINNINFFSILQISILNSQKLREIINGKINGIFVFDQHGNIYTNTGVYIKNPLNSFHMDNNFKEINGVQNNNKFNMEYKIPSKLSYKIYSSGNVFTNKKLIFNPTLKWILYTDDTDKMFLLYNPIQSKNFKNYYDNQNNNIQGGKNSDVSDIISKYCNNIQTNTTIQQNSPDTEVKYFADPTCNCFYTDQTCVNSISEYPIKSSDIIYDNLSSPYCTCFSKSCKYNGKGTYDATNTFLSNYKKNTINNSIIGKCPTPSISICSTILQASDKLNIKGSTLTQNCGGNVSKECPESCNGNGKCENGKCICNPGFSGLSCKIDNGGKGGNGNVSKECPESCNGNGKCENGKCICNPGFSGLSCKIDNGGKGGNGNVSRLSFISSPKGIALISGSIILIIGIILTIVTIAKRKFK